MLADASVSTISCPHWLCHRRAFAGLQWVSCKSIMDLLCFLIAENTNLLFLTSLSPFTFNERILNGLGEFMIEGVEVINLGERKERVGIRSNRG